jgi:HK97 family phage major capsid protein
MAEVAEVLKQELAAVRAAVEARGPVDVDALTAAVSRAVGQQVSAALDAQQSRPVFRGELVGPPGFQSVSAGVVEKGKFAGQRVDDLAFVRHFLAGVHRLEPGKVRPPSKELDEVVTRALSATGSGTGDEYVPTGMASQLWEDAFLASKVVSAIGPIDMPTDPWDVPLGWGALTWRKGTQNTQSTPQDPATAKSTMTATEQLVEINWSYDLDEDSVVAILPSLKRELARSAAEQMDAFTLNADATDAGTGNINLDDANPDNDSYYLSAGQDGIRHLYIVDNTSQSTDINTTLTDALLRAGIGRLGKYGAMTDRLVMVTNAKTYVLSMMGLTNVVTIDKFGPKATVLTGQLGSYGGIPVVASESMPLAEDDGKVSTTSANNDEGQIAIFHRDMWRVGFKRELLIEVDKDIKKRQFIMVPSFRVAVAARGTRSTATHTAGIHGITY